MPGTNIAIGGAQPYPSLEEVANLIRVIMNDSQMGATGTVGEGQILVDNQQISINVITALNEAIRQTYRELRNIGDPTLIVDNYIVTDLPVINGTQGPGLADPATQVCLGFQGFFDGTNTFSNYTLPANMLVPLRVWQRQTGTNNPFNEVGQAQDGLPSYWQGIGLGQWEWRSDGIWFNGSLQNNDVRIRYQRTFLPFNSGSINFTNTYIPIMDSTSAIAYKAAYILAFSLGSVQAPMLKTESDEQIRQLRNEQVRRAQGVTYFRPAYESEEGTGFGFGFGSGSGY